jgi:hypothetical protein
MSETESVGTSDPLRAVADAMDAAVHAVKEGAADAKETAAKAVPAVGLYLSRFVYTTCYTLSYGVVFPAMFVAKSIPTDNAIVHGLVDGARAATDMVVELKGSNSTGSSLAVLPPSDDTV